MPHKDLIQQLEERAGALEPLMPSTAAIMTQAAAALAQPHPGAMAIMRDIIRSTLWMAQRYANGRATYATSDFNRCARLAHSLGIDVEFARDAHNLDDLSDAERDTIKVQAEPARQQVYLDLDGVMADFDGHFPAVFGVPKKGLADDVMWEMIGGQPTFFRDMPPFEGAVAFFRQIEHLNPIILTACSRSNYASVAAQKRAWVRHHLSATATVLPVQGGVHKALFMHAKGDILIDDWPRNIDAWKAAGGIGILHTDFASTFSYLHLSRI